jgi:hypothetical protein
MEIAVTEYLFWAISALKFLLGMRIRLLGRVARSERTAWLIAGQAKDDRLSFFVMWAALIAESARLTSYPGMESGRIHPPISFIGCWIGFLVGVYLQAFLMRRSFSRLRLIGSSSIRNR